MSAWLLALLAPLAMLAMLAAGAAGLRQSGLYVDNGLDQTLMHRVVSQREKGEVEQEILSLLGLPERPPRRLGAAGPPQVRRSAPKFLLDIYRGALGEAGAGLGLGLGLSGPELRAIDQSDAIMTFAAHNGHVPGVRHERGKRLWFNVSEAPANERLLGAELRLYRSPPRHRPALPFTLTAYRVLRLQDGQRELQYVDAVNASAGHEGWLALNASAPLRHWLAQPGPANRGLYLSVHPADGRSHELRPEDVGLVAFRGPADRQPFLVGFFKSAPGSQQRQQQQQQQQQRQQQRPKREIGRGPADPAKRPPGSGKKHKPDVSSLEYRGNPYTEPQLQHSSRTCRIQTLYVSFRDLQWQDWIIAPDGYDAYYCSGECNFPLNAHMNATNHAIVQTLVHLVNPGKVPKPCCAPTKLSPISVLYFLDESNVILKKYKNMVVKSCGCH